MMVETGLEIALVEEGQMVPAEHYMVALAKYLLLWSFRQSTPLEVPHNRARLETKILETAAGQFVAIDAAVMAALVY